MNSMDRYIGKVLDSMFASPEDKERLEGDLRAHFADGQSDGETEAEIIRRMGPPEDVAASFMESLTPRFAGFWIRVLAFLADLGAIGSLSLPFYGLLLAAIRGSARGDDPGVLFFVAVVPISLWIVALCIFYFPVLEHHLGKTLGKHLLGLRVQTESRTRVGLGRAFLRRLSFFFEFLAIDSLFVPFTAKKQRALDIVAKTIVLRETVPVSPLGWLLSVALILVPLALLALVAFVSAYD